MRKLMIALLIGAGPAMAPGSAAALTSPGGPDSITVTGDNHIVCRRVTRTATRMRTGRVCRARSQWAREQAPGVVVRDPGESIDSTADTIETSGDKMSTGDIGGVIGPASDGVSGVGPY